MADSLLRTCLHMTAATGLALTLVGCGGMSRSDRPAEVQERSTAAPTQSRENAGDEVQIAAYTPPAVPQQQVARAQPSRAVSGLKRRADDERRSGDLDAAVVSLERALRIAPEDPSLWHELAEVRLDQKQYGRAEQLAAKSNALAGPQDDHLRTANWTLIAKARRDQGDAPGAREAERRAGLAY
jgi:tetratricopeptide (TPR) repeat protein